MLICFNKLASRKLALPRMSPPPIEASGVFFSQIECSRMYTLRLDPF